MEEILTCGKSSKKEERGVENLNSEKWLSVDEDITSVYCEFFLCSLVAVMLSSKLELAPMFL